MLRGKIFERNEEIRFGGQICPPPVCLELRTNDVTDKDLKLTKKREKYEKRMVENDKKNDVKQIK